jgi:hypothetical protein
MLFCIRNEMIFTVALLVFFIGTMPWIIIIIVALIYRCHWKYETERLEDECADSLR